MSTGTSELATDPDVSGATHRTSPALAHPVIERLDLPARRARHDDITRGFDTLRRKVARTACGRDGAFAGFDRLELAAVPDEDEDGRVVLTAVLVSATPSAQVVAYEAARIRGDSTSGDGDRHLIAQGVGRTVALG